VSGAAGKMRIGSMGGSGQRLRCLKSKTLKVM
jgi:hypothetical protein